MQTETEVLTDHNELICSTSIERIVTGRDAALSLIEILIHKLDDISRLTSSIGGDVAEHWAMRQGHSFDCWLMQPVDKAMLAITRNIDRSIWRDLMLKSGMLTLMDAEARSQWAKNLEEGDLPDISEANILSTFEQLHHNKQDVFERGIINVFKGLSWDYKTSNPCGFGKKIIINNLVKHDRWGYSLNWGWQRDHCWMVKPFPITGMMSPTGLWISCATIRISRFSKMSCSLFATFRRAVGISRSNVWI